ncbi:IPT/TIG domain-containing protein, partial [Collimonas sp. OK307]|uniref:beta strand repeat-containing protein n=1 Tax=Collimonas sp. OK307 TaxID=1801620 RepID=UPI0008F15DB3
MQHKIKKLCTQLVVTATTLAAMFLQKFRQKLKLQVGLGAFLLMLAFLSAAPEASAKTAQTITGFSPTTPITYSTGKTFTLSATGGGSGNPVTYASTTTTICTVAGSTANVLSAGTCMLTANQAGNTHYNAAPQVTANVVINPGSQTITFAALANKTLGDTPFTVSATSSSGLVVAFTSTTSSVCTASATTVTLVGAGTCIIAANQAGNSGYSAAAQVTQSFIVGASISYIYDPVGRLVEAVALNGTNSQYSYDVVGNILASQQHAGAAISITEFIPSSGPAGTTVTIYGSGFNPTPANNTVNFNGVAATVATATATSLSVVVPTSATTGPISVTNTNGTVTSAAPFTVGPSLPAGSNPIAINLAPNQSTSFNFSGVAGQGYELGLTGVATTPAGGYLTVTVTQPSGTTLVTCSVASDAGCVLPYLPVSGTYTVTLTAGSAATTLSVLLNLDLSGVLTANGPALNFSPTRIGQAVSYSFSGTTGQNLSLYLNGVTFPRDTGFYVYKPDGTQLNSGSVTHNSGVASWGEQTLTTLPTTGTYLVRVIPTGGIGGELTIALRAEVTGTLTVDGSATAVSLMAGQHGRYTFTGNAGQSLGLGLAGINTPPASTIITVTINKPDGSTLGSFNVSGPDYAYALPLLSVTGTYSVLVDPGNSTVTFNLLVSSDVTGSLIANGAALNFSPTRVGQAASYTFAGTVGQSANLSMAGDTFPGYTYFTVYKPDGTTLTSNFVYYGSGAGTSGSLSLSNFPVTGTYTVRVTPAGSLGSVSVALNGPVALTVDGAATAVNLTAGRNGLFSFSGNAGQSLGLGLAGISTTPAGGYISVTINKPDGSTLASFNAWGPDNAYAFPVLPATGTYSVQVNSGNNAAAFNLLVSSDATGSLTANGAALNFSPTRVGQAASYTFAGTVGQTINLSVGGDTFPGSTYFTVYKPDGTQLNYTWINSNGAATSGSLTLSNLPV